jgi:hypothetical protein
VSDHIASSDFQTVGTEKESERKKFPLSFSAREDLTSIYPLVRITRFTSGTFYQMIGSSGSGGGHHGGFSFI